MLRGGEEQKRWVQDILTALREEPIASSLHVPSCVRLPDNWREEITEFTSALDAVEERLWRIRQTLGSLD